MSTNKTLVVIISVLIGIICGVAVYHFAGQEQEKSQTNIKMETIVVVQQTQQEDVVDAGLFLDGEDGANWEYPKGIIRDKDGYTNVRSEASKSGQILTILHDGDVIYYNEVEGTNWCEVYDYNTTNFLGFVHRSRIKEK